MKRILTLLTAFTLIFTSCEGPQGPPGFDGQDGLNADEFAARVFEITVDFNEENDYQIFEPYGFEVLPQDVTLIYRLWEVDEETGLDVWRLLPQTIIFDDGSDLVYNFDFTEADVKIFLESTSDLGTLGTNLTIGQTFRVVVIPAIDVGRVDYSDINTVIELYNIESFPKR